MRLPSGTAWSHGLEVHRQAGRRAGRGDRAAWGPERSPEGQPSELDFWSGPLAAAFLAFAQFDELRPELLSEIRSFHVVDAVFGPLLFTGLLVSDEVHIVSVTDDPDYWSTIEDDPDD